MFDLVTYQLHKQEVARRNAEVVEIQAEVAPDEFATATTGSPYANNWRGVDIAPVYEPNVDWDFLSKQENFGFGSVKCMEVQENIDEKYWGQAEFGNVIQAMHNAGVPEIPYIFLNPLSATVKWGLGIGLGAVKALKRTENIEYTELQSTLTFKEYFAIGIDLERYWNSYTDYFAYLNHTITLDKVKVISPEWIAADLGLLIGHLIEGMKAKELRQVPIIVYSGKWFIEGYMVSGKANLFYDMAASLEKTTFTGADGLPRQQVHFWGASYTNNPAPADWSQFDKVLPNGTTQKPFYGNFTRPLLDQVGVYAMPNGKYPKTSLDLDVALWPKDQFDTALSITRGIVTPTPEPTPVPTPTPTPTPTPEPTPGEVIDIQARANVAKLMAWAKDLGLK